MKLVPAAVRPYRAGRLPESNAWSSSWGRWTEKLEGAADHGRGEKDEHDQSRGREPARRRGAGFGGGFLGAAEPPEHSGGEQVGDGNRPTGNGRNADPGQTGVAGEGGDAQEVFDGRPRRPR